MLHSSAPDYSALLGYYLGDGCVSAARRYFALRVSCDAAYPGIVNDVEQSIRGVRPGRRIFRVNAPGCVVVQSNWKHWPCLFPQHGPGRKHERTIALEAWQQDVVDEFPGGFLRGLFHSDGCRANNWASRVVAGEVKRYDYPRWQFTNNSTDIREICCRALDAVDVAVATVELEDHLGFDTSGGGESRRADRSEVVISEFRSRGRAVWRAPGWPREGSCRAGSPVGSGVA